MSEVLERQLKVRKLHPTIGAEVVGVDTSKPLDAKTLEAIKEVSAESKLLLFRNQSLTDPEMNAFAAQFGDTNQLPPTNKRLRSREHNVSVLGSNKDGSISTDGYALVARFWHTDSSWRQIPTWLSFLYCVEKPGTGGNTCFADMVAAYDALPAERKAFLDGKSMVHSYAFLRHFEPKIPELGEDIAPPPAVHPVVRTLDGRKSLFLNGHVSYYVGNMPFDEGVALHQGLIDYATAPQFVYEHQWAVGDLLVWDNRTTMHRVMPYDRAQRRVMKRAEVKCTEPPLP